MREVLLTEKDKKASGGIGGKAKNLIKLGSMGAKVPSWAVISQAVLLDQISEEADLTEVKRQFETLVVPGEILSELAAFFGESHLDKTYAVRSSAIDEDGVQFSFAGQFETFLHVSFAEIEEKIKAIWQSTASDRVLTYRKENKLPIQFGIGVIIQEMISPDVAGVAFGMHPVSGDLNSKIVSSVYGLGEGLVSGELDADTFTISPKGIEEQLTQKTYQFIRKASGTGIEKVEVNAQKQSIPSLGESQIKQIADLLDRLNEELGHPQDIEFAFQNETLFLLQTRPITTVKPKEKGEYILWDNSNIIESYPGITTPLTFSFIIKMYEQVYRQFVGLLGANKEEINKHSEVFANTLGLVRGRVYYNLLTWYKMLAMVPGYSINAGYMEKMMGVKERFELKEDFQMSKGLAWFRIIIMVFKMIRLQVRLPKERRSFMKHLNKVMTEYKAIAFDALSPKEIIKKYKHFETSLLLEWKAPLINDFFAMIWFGMLEKKATALCPDQPNIHNDLLCGSQDIISVEPIHKTIALSNLVQNDEGATRLFKEHSPTEIWASLEGGDYPEIKKELDAYIDKFGDRCVGELKLETVSYGQKPELFVKVVKSYVEQGITKKLSHNTIEEDLRKNAEEKINQVLAGKPLKKWWFRFITNKARDLVSNRENLRYERTRGFGMVRNMFSALGKQWAAAGYLAEASDVFYLKLGEIKLAEHTGFENTWKDRIAERKAEFAAYKEQEMPMERFYTYGNEFTDEYIYSMEKLEGAEEDLHGIGCCPGKVKGKVRIVMDPNEIDSLNGDILVTSSTDPGWVTLFPTASAIIVERGSLLSHSAIVSREMGIPCIVSVTGLLRTLKTGDEIIMDGSTGKIIML